MIKITFIATAALASFALGAQAAILDVMVSPWGNNQGGSSSPEPLYGTLTGLTGNQTGISNSPGVVIDQSASDQTPAGASALYNVTFSSHPTWGDVSFDLTVTASATGNSAGLLYNGGGNYFWTVDTGDDLTHGTAADENGDETRIRTGEFISFEVSNISSSIANTSVTFEGFTGLTISQNGSFDTATGLFTGADGGDGKGGRVNAIQFQLDATVVPEPGTYALLSGMLTLGFVMVRRRA